MKPKHASRSITAPFHWMNAPGGSKQVTESSKPNGLPAGQVFYSFRKTWRITTYLPRAVAKLLGLKSELPKIGEQVQILDDLGNQVSAFVVSAARVRRKIGKKRRKCIEMEVETYEDIPQKPQHHPANPLDS